MLFNMHNKKTKKIISGAIIAVLILAMVVPMVLSAISF